MSRGSDRRRRRVWPLAVAGLSVAILSMGVTGTASAATGPSSTPGLADPCDSEVAKDLPGPLALPCAGIELGQRAFEGVTALPGAVTDPVLEALAGWMARGVANLLETAGRAIFEGTEVDLFAEDGGQPWFVEHYGRMAALGFALLTPMLVLAVLHGALLGSLSVVGRAVANVPLVALGTAGALVVVQLLLGATDHASALLVGGLGTDAHDFLSGVTAALIHPEALPDSPAVGLFGVALVATFLGFAAMVVWLELLVREAAIYLTVLFLPLAFAGFVWPALSPWLRRLVEVIVALILSKLVIAAALALAGTALARQEGFALLAAGAAMLLLAAFAPFALFKLIPIAGGAAIASLEGQGRHGARAAAPRLSTAYYASTIRTSTRRSKATLGAHTAPGAHRGGTHPPGHPGPGGAVPAGPTPKGLGPAGPRPAVGDATTPAAPPGTATPAVGAPAKASAGAGAVSAGPAVAVAAVDVSAERVKGPARRARAAVEQPPGDPVPEASEGERNGR